MNGSTLSRSHYKSACDNYQFTHNNKKGDARSLRTFSVHTNTELQFNKWQIQFIFKVKNLLALSAYSVISGIAQPAITAEYTELPRIHFKLEFGQ